MDKLAIDQAKRRLKAADAAISTMQSASRGAVIAEAWSTFLVNANGVFAKLEQGAKLTPQSRQWYGAKKRARKADELMQYLHQARNADQHALQEVATRLNDGVGVGLSPGYDSLHVNYMEISNGEVQYVDVDNPEALNVTHYPGKVSLQPVFDDRSKIWYSVPTTHLQQPIVDDSPVAVATLALSYLRDLVREAEARAT